MKFARVEVIDAVEMAGMTTDALRDLAARQVEILGRNGLTPTTALFGSGPWGSHEYAEASVPPPHAVKARETYLNVKAVLDGRGEKIDPNS